MSENEGFFLLPVIVGLVNVFRRLGVSPRFLPLISIFLGLIAGLFYISPEDPKRGILDGIILGLSAVGLWSGVKNTLENKDKL